MTEDVHQPEAATTGETARATPRGIRRFVLDTTPLAVRPYRRLWSSTIVTAVGSQLTAVAVPKQLYDITGSAPAVGPAGAGPPVPPVGFPPWGGALARGG